ncbi:hypothetical protein [Xanthomonas bonasiae]|uniref:hypothetical protein n=1 Tax=Xanthomonas bonasiae TaxID=2810351 RepID=UPI001CD8C26A|nr:hypothetical protein [Xanthomonas surreyensis]
MHLNLLVLQESDAAVLPEGICIRRLSHHITQMFMALLPTAEINGSSKIVVSLGPRGEEDAFDNVLGVTQVFVEDFDFEHFLSLGRPGQDIRLLEALRGALLAIATSRGGNDVLVKLVDSTADAILNAGLQLLVPIGRLAKRSKDGKRNVTGVQAVELRRWRSLVLRSRAPRKRKGRTDLDARSTGIHRQARSV